MGEDHAFGGTADRDHDLTAAGFEQDEALRALGDEERQPQVSALAAGDR